MGETGRILIGATEWEKGELSSNEYGVSKPHW